MNELEKKTWIEIKDLIFETDPRILEHLADHCRRWRTMKNKKNIDLSTIKNMVAKAQEKINSNNAKVNQTGISEVS